MILQITFNLPMAFYSLASIYGTGC